MKTSTPAPTTEDDVAEAAALVDDAEQKLADLEGAVLAGDASVDGLALATAESEVKRRRISLAGIRERRAATAEAERLAAIDAISAEIAAAYGDHPGDVTAIYDDALEACTALAAVVKAHNDGLGPLVHRLLALAPLPDDLSPSRDAGQIAVGPVHVSRIDPAGMLASLVDQALTGAGALEPSQTLTALQRAAQDGAGVIDSIRRREAAISEWRQS